MCMYIAMASLDLSSLDSTKTGNVLRPELDMHYPDFLDRHLIQLTLFKITTLEGALSFLCSGISLSKPQDNKVQNCQRLECGSSLLSGLIYSGVYLQLALAPLWRAYEAAEPGADTAGILQKMIKGLSLSQVDCLINWGLRAHFLLLSVQLAPHWATGPFFPSKT